MAEKLTVAHTELFYGMVRTQQNFMNHPTGGDLLSMLKIDGSLHFEIMPSLQGGWFFFLVGLLDSKV